MKTPIAQLNRKKIYQVIMWLKSQMINFQIYKIEEMAEGAEKSAPFIITVRVPL